MDGVQEPKCAETIIDGYEYDGCAAMYGVADEVLRVVPINWQVTSLVEFITKGLRNSHHRLGMLQIRTALTKLENLHTRQKKIAVESLHFLVRENR